MERLAPRQDALPSFRPLYSFIFTVLCQVVGFAAGILLGSAGGISFAPLLAHTAAAGILARLLSLSPPWIFFNVLIPPAWFLLNFFSLSGGLLGLVLLTILLIFLPTVWTRVPFYPTSRTMYDIVDSKLPVDTPFQFVDLGSGSGNMIAYLARKHPKAQFYGYEISPLPFLLSSLRCLIAGPRNVKIVPKSFWTISLGNYDFIYAFLAPGPTMERLWEKVNQELRTGAVFMTNSFEVPGKPDETVEVQDERQNALYLFRSPLKTARVADG